MSAGGAGAFGPQQLGVGLRRSQRRPSYMPEVAEETASQQRRACRTELASVPAAG